MVIVPFLYFTLLSWALYRRNHKFCLAIYVLLIYAISGFFSILTEIYDIHSNDTYGYQISIAPTFVYCFLITLSIYPIAKFGKRYSLGITPIDNPHAITTIAIIAFLYFILFLVLSFSDLMSVLGGDMGEMRLDIQQGYYREGWMDRMNPIVRLPFTLMNLIFGASWILQFLAFYGIFIQKLPAKYGYMLLIASLMGPVSGMIGVDRSSVTYWLLSLGGCYVLFRPYMPIKHRKYFTFVGIALVFLMLLYLFTITNYRFGERESHMSLSGNQYGIIDYLGQPFVNFCFFFDKFSSPPYYNPATIFPFTFGTLLGEDIGVLWQHSLSKVAHVNVGVFYTFLGTIMLSMGKITMFLYVFLVVLFSYRTNFSTIFGRISLFKSFVYFVVASIPMLGLFGHYYSGPAKTFSVVVFIILLYYLSGKTKRRINRFVR